MSDEKVGHTPGPWAVHPRRAVIVPCAHLGRPLGAHEDPAVDAERYAQEICSLHWPDRNRKEQEVRANARLISAAPDLKTFANGITDDLGFAEWSTPVRKEKHDGEADD